MKMEQSKLQMEVFLIHDTLNRAMALTRSIGKLAEQTDGDVSDLGLMAEVATGLIQGSYTTIEKLAAKMISKEKTSGS